jgi:hypothetical protein
MLTLLALSSWSRRVVRVVDPVLTAAAAGPCCASHRPQLTCRRCYPRTSQDVGQSRTAAPGVDRHGRRRDSHSVRTGAGGPSQPQPAAVTVLTAMASQWRMLPRAHWSQASVESRMMPMPARLCEAGRSRRCEESTTATPPSAGSDCSTGRQGRPARSPSPMTPRAEICLLDGGHFLLESQLDAAAGTIRRFLDRTLS